MPEGDTVWRQARNLHRALAGRTVHHTSFRFPDSAEIDLAGETIHGAFARGKHLFIRIGSMSVHSHLKMEGIWHIYGTDNTGKPARWKRPTTEARAIIKANARLDSSGAVRDGSTPVEAVGYHLGMLDVVPTEHEERFVSHLGPDILGADWNLAQAVENIRKRPERMIGPALLDQKNLAGIGTIYRAETLFLAGVDPRSTVAAVPDLPRVVEIASLLLNANRARPLRVTRTVAEPLWVYGRRRQNCYRCTSPIVREELSDQGADGERFGTTPHRLAQENDIARLSYRCPTCQVLFKE